MSPRNCGRERASRSLKPLLVCACPLRKEAVPYGGPRPKRSFLDRRSWGGRSSDSSISKEAQEGVRRERTPPSEDTLLRRLALRRRLFGRRLHRRPLFTRLGRALWLLLGLFAGFFHVQDGLFLSTVMQRRRERQSESESAPPGLRPRPRVPAARLFPGPGPSPAASADRGPAAPGPRRVRFPSHPPPPCRPLLPKAHHFPGRPCHTGFSPQGPGGAGRRCRGPGLRQPPAPPSRPAGRPFPTWTSPGGWFRGGLPLPGALPGTCGAADRRRDRVGGGSRKN